MSLERTRAESLLTHESFAVKTSDREDHSFNGIMFDVECLDTLPLDVVVIESVLVRGALGPMTVFTTEGAFESKQKKKEEWTQVYSQTHGPSRDSLERLKLDTPIVIKPGKRCGIYVHSALRSDEGIIYDNRVRMHNKSDGRIRINAGMAHLHHTPFCAQSPWGYGDGWRRNREFVGSLEYGVRWLYWDPSPAIHFRFPKAFQDAVMTFILCSRNRDVPISLLPPEIIFFILNKLKWDSFGENTSEQPAPSEQSEERSQVEFIEHQLAEARAGRLSDYERYQLMHLLHYFGGHSLNFLHGDEEEDEDEDEEEEEDEDLLNEYDEMEEDFDDPDYEGPEPDEDIF